MSTNDSKSLQLWYIELVGKFGKSQNETNTFSGGKCVQVDFLFVWLKDDER